MESVKCPHCQNEDSDQLEKLITTVEHSPSGTRKFIKFLCSCCSKTFNVLEVKEK